MVAQKYKDMLQKKSVIRTLSEFATKRGQEIGYENVFDYSLGNPSVPVVQDYTDNTIRLLQTKTSSELHGYSPSVGLPSFKEKVAASLNKRFDMNYTANHIFPTSGAAGALAHALRAVTSPGDDVLTFAPYFPEYFDQHTEQSIWCCILSRNAKKVGAANGRQAKRVWP